MTDPEHWNRVYQTKEPTGLSWYRPRLDQSLRWIEQARLKADAEIVDVGGGASTLVDDLLRRAFSNLTVIDLSEAALSRVRERLGAGSERVRWIAGDATTPLLADASVDLWHDRAVFHFLTDGRRRDAYVAQLHRCVREGGHVMVGTFAPDGPDRCSGLPVARYVPREIAAALGPEFELVDEAREVHVTPSGREQSFAYAWCRR